MGGARRDERDRRYPPIADYGLIADGHSAALVSKWGSIDWCCMARIDHESVFGRLLDWDRGGYCAIAPVGDGWEARRRYLDGSLVLETTFRTGGGAVRLLDCFAMRRGGRERPYNQILRVVEGLEGEVELGVDIQPRFDYGELAPWIRSHGDELFTAIGGELALVIWTDMALGQVGRNDIGGRQRVRAGERYRLSLRSVDSYSVYPSEPRGPRATEIDGRFDRTLAWWRRWVSQAAGWRPGDPAIRSAIVVKGLTNAPTGAIAAAATTSLPEEIGGVRNWDYRYSWIRDSTFALRSLSSLGFVNEANGFRAFVERTTAGNPDQLQVAYGVAGEHRLTEIPLAALDGYRGSRPVRIGNEAWRQRQLDIYGELMCLAWDAAVAGTPPAPDYWLFLRGLVDRVGEIWTEPDRGIWEVRGVPCHFVFSKVMCWAAFDRGLRLAERLGPGAGDAPVERWRAARDAVRRAIETQGYDRRRGVFVQAFGTDALDASLLLLPRFGFVDYRDDRMIRTVEVIRAELQDADGLLRRYRVEETDDGLPGREGAFLACSFWLVECLARQGRRDEARRLFDRVSALSNDLGLFSEQYDPDRGEMLGNFPQGLTHYSHISAAVALGSVG